MKITHLDSKRNDTYSAYIEYIFTENNKNIVTFIDIMNYLATRAPLRQFSLKTLSVIESFNVLSSTFDYICCSSDYRPSDLFRHKLPNDIQLRLRSRVTGNYIINISLCTSQHTWNVYWVLAELKTLVLFMNTRFVGSDSSMSI